MVTVNAALALGESKSIGRITPGLRADLIAIPLPEETKDTFEDIVAYEGTIGWSMVNGIRVTGP
jgi:imidazolonepropionase-like amidohydrolase